MMTTLILPGAVAAYLLGSVSFSWIVVRLKKGIDVRSLGSGSAGSTNVLRAAGPGTAVLVLVMDLTRAGLVGWITGYFYVDCGRSVLLWPCALLAGNVLPIFHRFKGGKGVALSIGVFLGLAPLVGIIGLGVWLLGFFVSARRSSVGSLSMMFSYPVAAFLLDESFDLVLLALIFAAGVFVTHRQNLARLLRGEEPSLDFTRKPHDD